MLNTKSRDKLYSLCLQTLNYNATRIDATAVKTLTHLTDKALIKFLLNFNPGEPLWPNFYIPTH